MPDSPLPAQSEQSEIGLAVVFTYVPSEDRCYHTPFEESDDCPDPLTFAHCFREAEEERGDFPGSIWAVTGNDRAQGIRTNHILTALGIEDGGDA